MLGALLVPARVKADPGIDYVLIRDAPSGGGSVIGDRTYHTGDQETYYAAGYNITSGYVSDVLVEWYSDDAWVIDLLTYQGVSTTIKAKEYGTTIVTANANMSFASGSTGNLSVISDIDTIVLRDQPGGAGSWFGDMVMQTEEFFTLYAAGYNTTRGYLRDVPVDWSSTNTTLCSFYPEKTYTVSVNTYGEGTCKVEGTYSPGVTNSTGRIRIDSDIDYIIIRDASGGGGAYIGDTTYLIDQVDYYYAAGYNRTSGFLRNVRVHWTTSNPSVCDVEDWNSSMMSISFLAGGFCNVTANYVWVAFNTTGKITVLFDIDYLTIRDGPAGTGSPVGARTLYLENTITIYAAGYNNTDGFRRDLDVDWVSSNTTVCNGWRGSQKSYVLTARLPGICIMTATYKSGMMNSTGPLTVVMDIDYFAIRDVSGGGGNILGDKTVFMSNWYHLYAAAYNFSTGYRRDLDASWTSSNWSICDVFSGGWLEPKLPGTCTLTVDFRGLLTNTTGTITVYSDIDSIIIRDGASGGGNPVGDRTIGIGETDQYYAAGYNTTLGYRRDLQDATWSTDNTSVCNVNYDGRVEFETEGTCIITANWRGLVIGNTGTLAVVWNVDYIIIRDSPNGGGNAVGDRAYYIGNTDLFYAAGYNFSTAYRTDLKPQWTSSNTTVCTVFSRFDGSAQFAALSPGSCKVTADYLGRVSNSTGTLTVWKEINYIIVRDGPSGSGTWVGDTDYIQTTEHALYAAGYNTSLGFLRDISATWTTNNSASCGLVGYGSHVTVRAGRIGFCHVTADYYGYVSNSTGTIHIVPRPIITVDDDPGADYFTIHEALDASVDATIIRVYNGTYREHLVVNKSVTIEGLNKLNTWVNGSGTGTVFLVTADGVRITGLTVESADYGIFLEHVKSANVDHNTIRWYDYGIYSNYSTLGLIDKNLVTRGSNGIVTYHSTNDAVWNNEISYNTVYGAKDYDSTLVKCFNWNYFHHNNIAYYYDPDPAPPTLVLDGNIFEDNEIAIVAEGASAVEVTNNSVVRGEKGIVVINGSPLVANNSISEVTYGIELVNSSSFVFNNTVLNSNKAITATGGSPSFDVNHISGSTEYALKLEGSIDANVTMNDLDMQNIFIVNSTLIKLSADNGTYELTNCSWQQLDIGGSADAQVMWWVRIQVLSESGVPVGGASVKITDSQGNLVAEMTSDASGLTPLMALAQERINEAGTLILNPYHITVVAGNLMQKFEVTVESNRLFSVRFRPTGGGESLPWYVFAIIALALISLCLAAPLSIERGRYAVWTLFMPLYAKVKKEEVISQFTRGRILGYIEANPGEHFGAILQGLSLSNGNAVYHLRLLEKGGYVVSRNDRTFKRFYPKGMKLPPNNGTPLSELQQRILSCVRQAPGISQKEIVGVLGLRQSTLEYQIQKLADAGLIRREKVGRKVPLYLVKAEKK